MPGKKFLVSKYLLTTNEKSATVQWRKPADFRIGANGNCVSISQIGCHQKHCFCDGLDKDAKREPKKEKTLGKPKLKIILENNWPVIFKSVKVKKIKQRWRHYYRRNGN